MGTGDLSMKLTKGTLRREYGTSSEELRFVALRAAVGR